MKKLLVLPVVLIAALAIFAEAAPPVVTNIRAAQLAGTKNVEILYDVSDADGDALTIAMQVSGDAGASYTIPATALSGHIGAGVAPGVNRRIVWNVGADWNGQLVGSAKVRVTASDGTTPAPPPGMVYIPAGVFQMGDNFNEIGADTLPVHNVNVSGVFMDRFEVKKEVWDSVKAWGDGHGYTYQLYYFVVVGNGHPVENVVWYDAIKWCNTRSEMEGLTPAYYTDDAQTVIYRTGNVDLTNTKVKWTANGYRLPTEAEWEKAARGGLLGMRYPWGNTIVSSQANYAGSGDPYESGSPIPTTPVGYYNDSQIPTGTDMANGYGLYDVAGNVNEWCWDVYSGTYYGDTSVSNDPHGPASASFQAARVARGGLFQSSSSGLKVAQRGSSGPVPSTYQVIGPGFRSVRKAP